VQKVGCVILVLGADENVLPVDALEEVEKISPAAVTEILLAHLVNAWKVSFPNAPITEQNVCHLPCLRSFDPAARALTEQSAERVGLRTRLIRRNRWPRFMRG